MLLIEWGEKFPRILQQKDAEIVIRRVGHDERKVRLTTGHRVPATSPRHQHLLDERGDLTRSKAHHVVAAIDVDHLAGDA